MELTTAAALLGLATPEVGASIQFAIGLSGDAERRVVTYQCEGVEQAFAVDYLNAAPNFLAFVPVGGQRLLFVAVTSGSGARYVSGSFEWWVSGPEATFADLTEGDVPPVACTERNEIP